MVAEAVDKQERAETSGLMAEHAHPSNAAAHLFNTCLPHGIVPSRLFGSNNHLARITRASVPLLKLEDQTKLLDAFTYPGRT